MGPDGYLYILGYEDTLFRILPLSESTKSSMSSQSNNLPLSHNVDGDGSEESDSQLFGENNNQRNNSIPVAIIGINGSVSYSPNPIEIEEGRTITWYNGDSISHSVTSGEDNDADAGSEFDSNAIIPNQYYSFTFNESGDYKYYCIYHPLMVGEINVN